MFCPPTAPNRADKIAAHGACFPIVCAQRRPVPTRTTDKVPNRDQPRPPPSAPFPHRHLQAPRGFLLGRFPNAGRCHARRSRPPRPASENLHHSGRTCRADAARRRSPKRSFDGARSIPLQVHLRLQTMHLHNKALTEPYRASFCRVTCGHAIPVWEQQRGITDDCMRPLISTASGALLCEQTNTSFKAFVDPTSAILWPMRMKSPFSGKDQ